MTGTSQEQRAAYPLIFGEPYPDSVPLLIAFLQEQHDIAAAWYRTHNDFLYAFADAPELRWRAGEMDGSLVMHRHDRATAAAKREAYALAIHLLQSLEGAAA